MACQQRIPFAGLFLAGLTLLVSVVSWDRLVLGAAPAGCAELLVNGSFEEGGLGWQQTSAGGYNLISEFNPRTGSLGAYLAGINNADDRLSQQVTLPAGISTLYAWWSLATAETAGAFDQMTVSLLRSDGSLLADLLTVDNTAPADVWDEIVVDLSPYAGQAVVLRFTGRTDSANITDFYLDDVSIVACSADPQPTATATSTDEVTSPTPTVTLIVTPSVTPTPTVVALTATPTMTSSVTPTPTLTAIPTMTLSLTPTSTQTAAAATPTVTPSVTATQSPTLTATSTVTPEQGMRHIYLPITTK